MADPTVFDSTATNPGGTGTTITVTLPTHAVNDVVIVFVSNTGNTLWATNPTGWSRVDQRTVGTASTGLVGTWLWRKIVSGDSLPLTSPVCTLGATVSREAIAWTVRGSDLEGVFTLPEWGARGFATGTANPIRPPSVTTLAPGMLVLHGYAQRTSTNAPDPSGYTQDEETIISGTLVSNGSHKTVTDQQTALTNQDASPTSGVRWVAGILCIPSPDYPYYRSGSQATTASGTSVTPVKPTGTTNSDVNGRKDVMIATVEGAGSTSISPADTGLWLEVDPSDHTWNTSTSGGGSSVRKFWCFATATPNMQFNRTGTGEISACITTYHNCHQTSPIGVTSVRSNASSTTSTWNALTRFADRVAIQATCVADAVPTYTSPAGWLERMDGLGISCSDQLFNATGTTASAAFTLSSASPTVVGLLEIAGAASSPTLLGMTGTASLGTPSISINTATAGNASSVSIGSVLGSELIAMAGNAPSGQAGTLVFMPESMDASANLSGIESASAVGSIDQTRSIAARAPSY